MDETQLQILGGLLGISFVIYNVIMWKRYIAQKPEERDSRNIGSTAAIAVFGPIIILYLVAEHLFPARQMIVLSVFVVAFFTAAYLQARFIIKNRIFKDDSVSMTLRRRRDK